MIHDFFVPAFRVKADVIPGRYTSIWFQPTKPGRYHLFCAEYCGTRHSGMIGEVVVMEPSRVPDVAERRRRAKDRSRRPGEKLFARPRVQHLPSPRRAGPRPGARGPVRQDRRRCRAARRSSVDEAYVRESILTPAAKITAGFQPIMPTFQGLVTEEQLLELIEYVKSLKALPQVQTTIAMATTVCSAPAAPLPERRLRHHVVAADPRSQAHRAALSGRRHVLLLHRRRVRRADPPRAGDAGRRSGDATRPTTSCSRCTA